MIRFSETARAEVIKALSLPSFPEGYFLRVGLKGASCSATYFIGFDTLTDTDECFSVEGIQVIVARKHLMYLINSLVDYTTLNDTKGFVILPETKTLA